MTLSPEPLRKAAILVACLDHQTADALLDQMTPADADLVRRAALALDDIAATEQQAVMHEFLGRALPAEDAAAGAPVGDDDDEVDHAPAAAWQGPAARYAAVGVAPQAASRGSRGSPARQEATGAPAGPFRCLHDAQYGNLSPFLQNEHPQTIAVVVSHLRADQAAGLLTQLPPELQADVLSRLVDLEETSPEVLQEIERGLESWLSRQAQADGRRHAGLATVIRILEAAPGAAGQRLWANVALHAPHLARQLPRRQWSYRDLERLDDEALDVLYRAADPRIASLALAGSSGAWVERWLAVLPPREARFLRQSWNELGPTSLRDIERAQQELMDTALELMDAGRIDAPRTLAGQRTIST